MMTRRLIISWLCAFLGGAVAAGAGEPWETALGGMPLGTNVAELNETNCVKIMLRAFQSNATVKALIFMPGAIDEFYWEHRAKAELTNENPSLLDAVNALTNQTRIRATFRPPMLLLYTPPDLTEPGVTIRDAATARRIMQRRFVPHASYNDRDWDYMLPILRKTCGVDFRPGPFSRYSFHFYRHSFAAWNLTAWEGLEAVSLANRTVFTVDEDQVVFTDDWRGM
jgi:hypothetical protein